MNYVELNEKSLLFNVYAYVDTDDFFADNIFERQNLKAFFRKHTKNPRSKFVLSYCKILKKDTEKFEFAMNLLNNKMLLLGYEKYISCFEKIVEKVG